jgi:hypothetical protein
MTDEEHAMLRKTLDELAAVRGHQSKIDAWLYEPFIDGHPARSAQIDALLTGRRVTIAMARVLTYLGGALMAAGSAWLFLEKLGIGKWWK